MKGDSGAIPARRAASCRSGVCATAGHPRWTGSFSRTRRCSRATPSPARGALREARRRQHGKGKPRRHSRSDVSVPTDHASVSFQFLISSPARGTNAHCRTSLELGALHCRNSAGHKPQEPLQNCHAQAEAVKCIAIRSPHSGFPPQGTQDSPQPPQNQRLALGALPRR
jgi:hypothetical protein